MQQQNPGYSMSLCDMCNMLRPICSSTWCNILDVINYRGSRSLWWFTICPRVTAVHWAELTLSHWYSTRAIAYLFSYRCERACSPLSPSEGLLFCQVSVSIGSHAALWPGYQSSWCSVVWWDVDIGIGCYERRRLATKPSQWAWDLKQGRDEKLQFYIINMWFVIYCTSYFISYYNWYLNIRKSSKNCNPAVEYLRSFEGSPSIFSTRWRLRLGRTFAFSRFLSLSW